jgi:hypothetical protein
LLLSFQEHHLIIFLSCTITAILISYDQNFLFKHVFSILPIEAFQITGSLLFLLMGMIILYKLMFSNISNTIPKMKKNLFTNYDDSDDIFPHFFTSEN